MSTTIALVVAAGRGSRFGGEVPKQYRTLAGVPLLRYSLLALSRNPEIDAVRAVIHRDDQAFYEEAAKGLNLLSPVLGGKTRQESVINGLQSLHEEAPDHVLIHDGARPFVTRALISRLMRALEECPGALPALRIVDSLKIGNEDLVTGEMPREGLWRAQTPQAFKFDVIREAHRQSLETDPTAAQSDDAVVVRLAGHQVRLVDGEEGNLKVTSSEDLEIAENWLRLKSPASEVRVGNGFDVHRFGPGDRITLCGLEIESHAALIGHSDADVALHALTDAILGALGAGDIGQHFPPSDPKWKGAASARFLEHAADLVRQKGGRILNVDLTLICEAPKIGPHREAMRQTVADILGIALSRVSVKATTTEKLGFTGRSEGIAAEANAALELPSADEV